MNRRTDGFHRERSQAPHGELFVHDYLFTYRVTCACGMHIPELSVVSRSASPPLLNFLHSSPVISVWWEMTRRLW